MTWHEKPHIVHPSKITKKTSQKEAQSSRAAAPKDTIRQARVLLEKQLEEADRLEAERIAKKRAPKTKTNERKEEAKGAAPRLKLPLQQQNPPSSSRKTLSTNSYHNASQGNVQSTLERPSNATISNYMYASKLLSNYEKLHNDTRVLNESFPSQAQNRQFLYDKSIVPQVSPLAKLKSPVVFKHEPQGETLVAQEAVWKPETDHQWKPAPSRITDSLKHKEIIYDFTEASPACIPSVQADAFTDGSMLSPKIPEKEPSLPSYMELDDGILYDMRSTPESQDEDTLENLDIPDKMQEHTYHYDTSESEEEPQPSNTRRVAVNTQPTVETRAMKAAKKKESSRAGAKAECTPYMRTEKEGQEQNSKKQQELGERQKKRIMLLKQQKKQNDHPTPPVPPNPNRGPEDPEILPPNESLRQFTAMREKILYAQQRLSSAQRQMEAILPIFDEFQTKMTTFEMPKHANVHAGYSNVFHNTFLAIAENGQVEERGKYSDVTEGVNEGASNSQAAEEGDSGSRKKRVLPKDRNKHKQIKRVQAKGKGRGLSLSQDKPPSDNGNMDPAFKRPEELVPSIEVDDNPVRRIRNEIVSRELQDPVPSSCSSLIEIPILQNPQSSAIFGDWEIDDFSYNHGESSKKNTNIHPHLSPEQDNNDRPLKKSKSNFDDAGETGNFDLNRKKSRPVQKITQKRSPNPSPSTLSATARANTLFAGQRVYTPSTISPTPTPTANQFQSPNSREGPLTPTRTATSHNGFYRNSYPHAHSNPQSYLQSQTSNPNFSNTNLRLITPIPIINKSAYDSHSLHSTPSSYSPTPSEPTLPNPTLQRIKRASYITPTLMPFPRTSAPLLDSTKKRIYTPSSMGSTPISSSEADEDNNGYDDDDDDGDNNEGYPSNSDLGENAMENTNNKRKKAFFLKKPQSQTLGLKQEEIKNKIKNVGNSHSCLATDPKTIQGDVGTGESDDGSIWDFSGRNDDEMGDEGRGGGGGWRGASKMSWMSRGSELDEGLVYDFSNL